MGVELPSEHLSHEPAAFVCSGKALVGGQSEIFEYRSENNLEGCRTGLRGPGYTCVVRRQIAILCIWSALSVSLQYRSACQIKPRGHRGLACETQLRHGRMLLRGCTYRASLGCSSPS